MVMVITLLILAAALSGLGEIGFLPWRIAAARAWVRSVLGWRIHGVFDGQHTYRWAAIYILCGLFFADGAAWAAAGGGPLHLWLWPWIIHVLWMQQVRNLFFHSGLVMRKMSIDTLKTYKYFTDPVAGVFARTVLPYIYEYYPDWSRGQRVMLVITSIAEVVLWVK